MFKVVLLALFAHAINGQSDSCNTSRSNFFNEYPDCLEAFEGAVHNVSRGYGVGNATTNLICVDTSCRMAIADYTNSCITDMDHVVMAQHQLYTFGCILLSEGEACFNKVSELEGGFPALLTEVNTIFDTCQSEYTTGICSENCVQSIITLVDKLDCCYSEAVRSISSMLSNQTELALKALDTFTRGYFLLCDLELPTFCQDVPPPSECSLATQELIGNSRECIAFARQILTGHKTLTSRNWPGAICLASILRFSESCDIEISITEECMTATDDLFSSNDSCTQAFTTIPDNITANISFEQADRALDTVCGAVGCKNRVIDFTDSCFPEREREQYETFVLQLGCRTNFDGSCAAQLYGQLDTIAAAFDVSSGICLSAVAGIACSPGCASIIEKAVNETDCCVYEVAQAGLDLFSTVQLVAGISIDSVFSTCEITNPGRCDEQTEGTLRYAAIDAGDDIDDNDDDNDNDNIDDDDDDNDNNNIDDDDDDDDIDDDDIDDGNDGSGASLIVGCTMLISLLALLPMLTA